ncbi:MAG: phage regulatory CII family protein [Smithella sp.]
MKSLCVIELEAPIQAKLQDAFYKTVHHGAIPLKAIAAEFKETVNYYTKVGLPLDDGGCYYQVQKLPKLFRLAQRYDVLDVLEHSVGRVGVPLPPISGASTSDVCRLTMKTVSEFGHMVSEVEKAIMDNHIKPSERDRIIKEGYEAVQAILTLM